MNHQGCINCQIYPSVNSFFNAFYYSCIYCNRLFYTNATKLEDVFPRHNNLNPDVDNYLLKANYLDNIKRMCGQKPQVSGVQVERNESIRIYLPGMIIPQGWSVVLSSNGSKFIKGPKIASPTTVLF